MITPHKALLIQARDALQYAVMSSGGETGCNHEYQICFCKELSAIAALQAAIDAPEPEPHKGADDYLRYKYGAYRGHFAWRELEDAYSQGRYDESMAQGPSPYPGDAPEPVGHLYTIEGVQYCNIFKVLPDCALYAKEEMK